MIRRTLEKQILEILRIFPAVYVNGPRQAGKTTLVRELLAKEFKGKYVTFDDALERITAKNNPMTYLADCGHPLIIDGSFAF
ncbi:MAG: AAA family ATPase [Pseudomonadota bacterium]